MRSSRHAACRASITELLRHPAIRVIDDCFTVSEAGFEVGAFDGFAGRAVLDHFTVKLAALEGRPLHDIPGFVRRDDFAFELWVRLPYIKLI